VVGPDRCGQHQTVGIICMVAQSHIGMVKIVNTKFQKGLLILDCWIMLNLHQVIHSYTIQIWLLGSNMCFPRMKITLVKKIVLKPPSSCWLYRYTHHYIPIVSPLYHHFCWLSPHLEYPHIRGQELGPKRLRVGFAWALHATWHHLTVGGWLRNPAPLKMVVYPGLSHFL
jgi:hypothetical protein